MSDSDNAAITDELTSEEQQILLKALKRIEGEIFVRVLKRISWFLGILLSVLLVGGLININSCSSNIETSAAQKLSSDPELRDKIVNKAQGDFKDTDDKLKKLNEQIAELEKANARAATTSLDDLTQIRLMVGRISEELTARLKSETNRRSASPKKKANE